MFELEIWPTANGPPLRLNERRLMSNQTPAEWEESGQTLWMQTSSPCNLFRRPPAELNICERLGRQQVGEQNVLKNQAQKHQHNGREFNKSGKWPLISDCVCVVGDTLWNCSLVKLVLGSGQLGCEGWNESDFSKGLSHQLGLTLNPKTAAGRAETR